MESFSLSAAKNLETREDKAPNVTDHCPPARRDKHAGLCKLDPQFRLERLFALVGEARMGLEVDLHLCGSIRAYFVLQGISTYPDEHSGRRRNEAEVPSAAEDLLLVVDRDFI